MAKKPRPAFNLPPSEPAATPAASPEWVYRSDEEARKPADAPASTALAVRLQPSERLAQAREIVGNYTTAAAGAGLVPLPVFDVLAIGGLQLKMISALAALYDLPFSHDRGKALVAALVTSVSSTRLAFGLSGSLLKFVPVLGPLAAMLAMPGLGGAVTYAVGSVFVQHFEAGGTLLTFDAAKMRRHFQRELRQAEG